MSIRRIFPRPAPLWHPAFISRQPLHQLSNRCFQTSSTTQNIVQEPANSTPVHPSSRFAPPESYLHREANRQLPPLNSLNTSRRTWALTIPVFFAIVAVSALGIFNYQKVNSPIVESTLYALRTNVRARELLGDEVYFASRWAWVWGHINLVQGRVDINFKVKGTRRKANCRFRARRVGGRNGLFQTQEWSLTMDDTGDTIQLLDSQKPDPLAQTMV